MDSRQTIVPENRSFATRCSRWTETNGHPIRIDRPARRCGSPTLRKGAGVSLQPGDEDALGAQCPDLFGAHRCNVGAEYDEIGELAGFEGAEAVFGESGVGAAEAVGVEGSVDGQGLTRAPGVPPYRGGEAREGVEALDGAVAGKGDGDAGV